MEFDIARLGAAGDGIATGADGRPVFIPYALPGERVVADPAGKQGEGQGALLREVLRASPERAVPPCPYFGRCGGCVMQHMAIPPYAAWKRARLAEALSRAGHDDAGLIAPPAVTPPQTRRCGGSRGCRCWASMRAPAARWWTSRPAWCWTRRWWRCSHR